MVVEMSTESAATASDTRAPTSTRASTSRLAWSVPKGCASDGGRFCIVIRLPWTVAEWPHTTGPSTAATHTAPRTSAGQRAEGSPQKRARKRRGGLAGSTTNPRVDSGLQHVGAQVAQGDHHGADDHSRGDQVIVARANRVGGHQSHAGPCEDALHEQRAAQQQ